MYPTSHIRKRRASSSPDQSYPRTRPPPASPIHSPSPQNSPFSPPSPNPHSSSDLESLESEPDSPGLPIIETDVKYAPKLRGRPLGAVMWPVVPLEETNDAACYERCGWSPAVALELWKQWEGVPGRTPGVPAWIGEPVVGVDPTMLTLLKGVGLFPNTTMLPDIIGEHDEQCLERLMDMYKKRGYLSHGISYMTGQLRLMAADIEKRSLEIESQKLSVDLSLETARPSKGDWFCSDEPGFMFNIVDQANSGPGPSSPFPITIEARHFLQSVLAFNVASSMISSRSQDDVHSAITSVIINSYFHRGIYHTLTGPLHGMTQLAEHASRLQDLVTLIMEAQIDFITEGWSNTAVSRLGDLVPLVDLVSRRFTITRKLCRAICQITTEICTEIQDNLGSDSSMDSDNSTPEIVDVCEAPQTRKILSVMKASDIANARDILRAMQQSGNVTQRSLGFLLSKMNAVGQFHSPNLPSIEMMSKLHGMSKTFIKTMPTIFAQQNSLLQLRSELRKYMNDQGFLDGLMASAFLVMMSWKSTFVKARAVFVLWEIWLKIQRSSLIDIPIVIIRLYETGRAFVDEVGVVVDTLWQGVDDI